MMLSDIMLFILCVMVYHTIYLSGVGQKLEGGREEEPKAPGHPRRGIGAAGLRVGVDGGGLIKNIMFS